MIYLPVHSSRSMRSLPTRKPTCNESATYFMEVKHMFQDNPEKYYFFRELVRDYQAEIISTPGVIQRVKELCKGYTNLLLGFNIFLPEGYAITVAEDDNLPPKRTREFEEAISFVMKIKERFQSDDHVYKTFLDIINMYKKGDKGIDEVLQEVTLLFDGHPDLLSEYRDFFPDV